MRVLLLNTTFRQEGPNNTFFEIAKRGRAAGVEVWAGAVAGRGPMEDAYRRCGVPTVHFGRFLPGDLTVASRVRAFLVAHGVDLVCAQLLRGEVVGALAVQGLLRCRLICVVQNEDPYRIALRNPPKALLSRWALGRATRVVVVSHALRGFVVRHQGIPSDVVDVIPNAVDSALSLPRNEDSRPRDLPGGRPLIGCVGRLSRQKGQDVLVAAFHEVIRRLPDARLVLVGGGPSRWSLRVAAGRGPGRSRISFPGWRANVGPYLPFLDIVAQPSRWEGMPFATLEAMAEGVAVIASSVGGLCELLADGCGTLVPPGDSHALARAIHSLATNDTMRAAQAVAGRQRVLEEYRPDRMYAAYSQVFHAVARASS